VDKQHAQVVQTALLLWSMALALPPEEVLAAVGIFNGMVAAQLCPETAHDIIERWAEEAHQEANAQRANHG
jgi:hypothetical protein